MTLEEFKKAVYEECKKDKVTEKYPEDFERVFKEEEEEILNDYKEGKSPAHTAWGISLLI